MKDWLNLPWWQDKTPLEKETGQYVLNVGAVGSSSAKKPAPRQTSSEKPAARSVTENAASPRPSMPPGREESSQNEFQLRDPLKNQELPAVVACPVCGSRPVFDRRPEIGPNGTPMGHYRFEYRVRCRWQTANWDPHYHGCQDQTTPWLKSLDLAVRHWTLAIKLAK